MRLLLDECIDERLRHLFTGHDCQTVRYTRLAGLKNEELILAAETAGFDVIVTADQSIPSQQNLSLVVAGHFFSRHYSRAQMCHPQISSPPESCAWSKQTHANIASEYYEPLFA